MFGFADVKTVANTFDNTGLGVKDLTVKSLTVCNANTSSCTLIAFRRYKTTVYDVAVKDSTFSTVVDADTVTGKSSVGCSLSATLNNAAKAVDDVAGYHVTKHVTDLRPGQVVPFFVMSYSFTDQLVVTVMTGRLTSGMS